MNKRQTVDLQERPDPLLSWPLAANARSAAADGPHGRNRGAVFATVDGRATATFPGRGESVTISDTPALRLGKGDFTISVRVHTRLADLQVHRRALSDGEIAGLAAEPSPESRRPHRPPSP